MAFVRIVHPVTGRFICELDLKRAIMRVTDRGKDAVIDLAQLEAQNDEQRRDDTRGKAGAPLQLGDK